MDNDDEERVRNCSLCEGQYLHNECDHFGSVIAPSPAPTPPSSQAGGAAASSGNSVEVWRHVKTGGLYRIIVRTAILEADATTRFVIYTAVDGKGPTWARPYAEFFDGRFIRDAGTPGPAGAGELAETCAVCGGSGTLYTSPPAPACLSCSGSGRSPTTRPERQNNGR